MAYRHLNILAKQSKYNIFSTNSFFFFFENFLVQLKTNVQNSYKTSNLRRRYVYYTYRFGVFIRFPRNMLNYINL